MFILGDIFCVVADGSKEEAFRIKKVLKSMSVKNVIAMNVICLNNFCEEVKNLLKNNDKNILKIFYGGSEKNFNDMKLAFGLSGREDIFYAGNQFEVHEFYKIYWKYRFKIFTPLVSSKSEEI